MQNIEPRQSDKSLSDASANRMRWPKSRCSCFRIRQATSPDKFCRRMEALLFSPAELDFFLRLVLSFAVLIGNFARLIRLKEKNLAKTFIRKDSDGNRSRICDRYRDESFPLRFKWRDIHQDSCTRIRGFADAQGQHV